MICRTCGTDIADKALICYRCGAATAEPRAKPDAPRAPRSTLVPAALGLIILSIAALYLGQATADATPTMTGWVLAAMAAIAIGLHVSRRGRRR